LLCSSISIAVSYAIRYWSKGTVEPLFLRHEGYLGAIGAFLKGTEDWSHSWTENYAGSSGFVDNSSLVRGALEILEMDRAERPVAFFPLLSADQAYTPDTVNLSNDPEARNYWINCLQGKEGNENLNSQIPEQYSSSNPFM